MPRSSPSTELKAVLPPCPSCGNTQIEERFSVSSLGTENGVNAEAFRPSADRFGSALGMVAHCRRCGHGFIVPQPSPDVITAAYADGIDPVSLREEDGQVETARRALARIETYRRPTSLCDLGCWTGSFLVAARERGWETAGVELSQWASDRARERKLDVFTGSIGDQLVEADSFDVVVLSDVLEHVPEPAEVLAEARRILRDDGMLWITVPDAGSRVARLMGSHWWSVLPMHLHYFSRRSMEGLLADQGFSITWSGTHAKVFTTQYYAERLSGYSSVLARGATAVLRRVGLSDRMIAPDFRDRLGVLAVKTRRQP